MQKNFIKEIEEWETRPEYDFSNARPNKYAEKYAKGTNIVLIEPDLMDFFPDNGNKKR